MWITDCSDPVFHPEKILALLLSGEPGILITKDPVKLAGQILAPADQSRVVVQVSITGLGGTPWEPRVIRPEHAWEGVKLFTHAGFKTIARFDPIIPGVNDSAEQMAEFLVNAKDASVDGVTCSVMDQYPRAAMRIMSRSLEYTKWRGFNYPERDRLTRMFLAAAKTLEVPARVCCETGFSCEGGCDYPDLIVDVSAMELGKQRPDCTCPRMRQALKWEDECKHGCAYCYRRD